jgi:VanZ family protein
MEYLILAQLLFGAVYLESRKKYVNFLIPFLIASLYSVSDEVHQFFVSERPGTPVDVLIDSAGALAGVLLVYAIVLIVKRIRTRKR